MSQLYAGTSGWAYPSWKPQFYPAKLASKKFLEYYGTRLNSVELNFTFRRFASEKFMAGWNQATPAGFMFSPKAHQMITHIKRLRDAEDFTRQFLASLQPLSEAGKLGTVLFQLPPFLKADAELLRNFLAALPRSMRFAFEFRHSSWFNDQIFTLLRDANAALCLAESDKLTVPDVQTADFTYFRLRKPNYSAEERKQTAGKVSKLLAANKDVFVYYKHEETPEGAGYAEELLAAVKMKSEGAPS